jgi:hypothetical protein
MTPYELQSRDMKPAKFLPVQKTDRSPEIIARDILLPIQTMWNTHVEKNNILAYRKATALYARRYRQNNRRKVYARKRVYMAVRSGKLKRSPCYCGEVQVEGHHKDYSKPLEVIWLCKKHHSQADKLDKTTIPTRNV